MKLERSKKLTVVFALVTCAACTSLPTPPNEDLQTAEYLKHMAAILIDFQEKEEQLKAEAAKAAETYDLHEKENSRVAILRLADSMEKLSKQIQPYISGVERLKPPERLREHQAVSLECTRGQANSVEQMVQALRNSDKRAYAVAMEQYYTSIQNCPKRIRTTLQKAGFNSPEDIDNALRDKDFWQAHGIWFLLGCLFLPRVTLLFFVFTPFNWLAWLGWILTPSFVVAFLATSHYWTTNPVLCVCAWIVAVSKLGGSGETARRKNQ